MRQNPLTLRFPALSLPIALIAAVLLTGCSNAKRPAVPTPEAALAPTLTPTRAPASSPEAGSPTPAAAPASPTGTPLVSLTPLPTIVSGPCKSGQVKGDKASHNLYTPGFPGYSDLNSNVDCFDSIDKAKDAGYHIPGQGG
jgi:hypothetical protein